MSLLLTSIGSLEEVVTDGDRVKNIMLERCHACKNKIK